MLTAGRRSAWASAGVWRDAKRKLDNFIQYYFTMSFREFAHRPRP
jgi:hypothetical protein